MQPRQRRPLQPQCGRGGIRETIVSASVRARWRKSRHRISGTRLFLLFRFFAIAGESERGGESRSVSNGRVKRACLFHVLLSFEKLLWANFATWQFLFDQKYSPKSSSPYRGFRRDLVAAITSGW